MDQVSALSRIVENDHARRELLWLRAMEKDDTDSARDLERVDPGIPGRLRADGVDITVHDDELPRARRERFGRLFDECFQRHAERLARRGWE